MILFRMRQKALEEKLHVLLCFYENQPSEVKNIAGIKLQSLAGIKLQSLAGIKLQSGTQEIGGYVVIYEQVFPKYHRMSAGTIDKIA